MPPHIRHTVQWVLVRVEVVESFVAAVDLASKYLLYEVLIVMINSLSRSDLEILPCGVGVGVASVWQLYGTSWAGIARVIGQEGSITSLLGDISGSAFWSSPEGGHTSFSKQSIL